MDLKQFVADIVSSIAWPAVTVLFLVVFRTELSKIIRRLARLKYKDWELEFAEIEKLQGEVSIDISKDRLSKRSPIFKSLEEQVLDAVEQAPFAAILLAWSGLETSLASTVSRLAISPDEPSYRSPKHNIDMLINHGSLSKPQGNWLNSLRVLRDKLAHEQESMTTVTQSQARTFAHATTDWIKFLEAL